jgi:hypothetical protein
LKLSLRLAAEQDLDEAFARPLAVSDTELKVVTDRIVERSRVLSQ